ncbi:MAG: DUF4369 domain-containing protein [Flavobacteriales bacterium]|nr:DUF4369 domain-containing protein [Flavobacteriales bacterium]
MRKIVSVLILSLVLFSCSKVKKGEFLISGTAKGIENGKSVVLQTQDDSGMMMMPVDTVKVKDGKFEFKGKIKEPKMYSIVFPELRNGFSLIVENDEVKVEVYKDSIQSSKISGTYYNDEFYKFNVDMRKLGKTVEKKMQDFQTKNLAAYQQASTQQDTVTMNKIMKEANKIQSAYTDTMLDYAKENPKSFISLLIVENMFRMPNGDPKKIKEMYDSLDDDLKQLKGGKKIKDQLAAIEKAKKNPAPQPTPAPAAAPAQ